jgi:hypothetical protein
MIKVTPTIFVGLGTSGLAMINSVRELLFEEFLCAGFPCVRFLHVTSEKGGEPHNLHSDEFNRDYEKIKLVDISISQNDYQQVSLMLNPNDSTHYNKGLAEWLPADLARMGDVALENGMRGERKLGRLALWLKWNTLTNAINNELGMIQHAQHRTDTNNILKNYYSQKNVPTDGVNDFLDTNINIFVVGTLLGGTCSGSFLDTAFYLRKNYPNATVYGIFTLLDAELSAIPNYSRQAANAYAAMREIDYYTQNGTVYDYFLPNTQYSQSNINPPFSHLSFITTKNTIGTRAPIINQDGTNDLESLHKMIGLSMFFATVAGTNSALQSLRVDWQTDHFKPLAEPPRYLKTFTSFGAVALWYPKSKISGASASKFIDDKLCKNWLGEQEKMDLNYIKSEANSLLQRIVSEIEESVATFIDDDGSKVHLKDHWRPYPNAMIQSLDQKNVNIDDVRSYLLNNPSDSPIASRFKLNGYYYQKMLGNQIVAKNRLFQSLENEINKYINNSMNSVLNQLQQRMTLSEIQQLSNELLDGMSVLISKQPNLATTDLTFEELEGNFEAARIEQKRTLTMLVGAREDILRQHYQLIANNMIYLLEAAQDQLLKNFIAKILNDNLTTVRQIISSSINEVYQKVTSIKSLAQEKYRTLKRVQDYSSLKIILQRQTIDEEVDYYSGKINHSSVQSHLSAFISLILNKQRSEASVFFEMLNFLQTEVLRDEEITNFRIVNNLTNPILIGYARNAEPMFEPSVRFRRIPYTQERIPTLIGGGDRQVRHDAKNEINRNTNNPVQREVDLDLNHLIYIYKEEAGIAISEFETFHHMEAQYKNGNHKYGCHIDKNPDRFDIERFLTLKEIQEENWFKVARELCENEVFDEIIHSTQTGKYYKILIKDEDGLNTPIYFFPNDEHDFLRKLSDNSLLFIQFKNRFNDVFIRNDRGNMRNRVNQLLERISMEHGPDSNLYQSSDEFYKELIRKKYPPNNN